MLYRPYKNYNDPKVFSKYSSKYNNYSFQFRTKRSFYEARARRFVLYRSYYINRNNTNFI